MSDFVRFTPPLEEDECEHMRKAIAKMTVGTAMWGLAIYGKWVLKQKTKIKIQHVVQMRASC